MDEIQEPCLRTRAQRNKDLLLIQRTINIRTISYIFYVSKTLDMKAQMDVPLPNRKDEVHPGDVAKSHGDPEWFFRT